MMRLEEYLKEIEAGRIPAEPPQGTSMGGWGDLSAHAFEIVRKAREQLFRRGCWTVIDQVWTRKLAEWIGWRTVLEVMAGGGLVAKALEKWGVSIVATDAMLSEWIAIHDLMEEPTNVIEMDGMKAIQTFGPASDILLIVWPPVGDEQVIDFAEAWGREKPIVYIGERNGYGPAHSFWRGFGLLADQPIIPLHSWPGIHDKVMVGRWLGVD